MTLKQTTTFTRLVNLEEFGFWDCTNLGERHLPLSSLLLTLLFDHVAQDLGLIDTLTIHQIRWDCCTIRSVLRSNLLCNLFFMHQDPALKHTKKNMMCNSTKKIMGEDKVNKLLAHCSLFTEALLMEELGTHTTQPLRVPSEELARTSFLLPQSLCVIKAVSVLLTPIFNIISLRLFSRKKKHIKQNVTYHNHHHHHTKTTNHD